MKKHFLLFLSFVSLFLYSCKANIGEDEKPLSSLIITSSSSSIKEGDVFAVQVLASDNRSLNKIFWSWDNNSIVKEEETITSSSSSTLKLKALTSGNVIVQATEKETNKKASIVIKVEPSNNLDASTWPNEENMNLPHVRIRMPKDESVRENFTEDTIQKISSYVAYSTDELAKCFPKAFGYLKEADIGMGLKGGPYGSGTSMATTGIGPRMDKISLYGEVLVPIEYNVTIYLHNFERYDKDENGHKKGDLTDKGIRQLKEVLPHEMMHAMMGETLTSGMVNRHIDSFTYTDGLFPNWFIEGTATTIGGIGGPKGRLSTHQIKDLESSKRALTVYSIKDHPPTYNTETWYGTGYLAVMYLGHSISSYIYHDTSITSQNIRRGLDLLLESMTKGYSMVDSINRLSGTNYKTVNEFEIYFTDNGAEFCLQLVKNIKNGNGSLLNDNLSDTEFPFLKDDYSGTPVFRLNPDSTDVSNFYNHDTAVIKGGGREVTGYDRFGGYPSDALPPEGYKKGDNPLPLSKPDGFNPYKKISNTTITLDFPELTVGDPFPTNVICDINGENLYKDYPLFASSNITWTDSESGKEVEGIVQKDRHYTANVTLEAKGYIKEDEGNLYGSYARFLENNSFIVNGQDAASLGGVKITYTPYRTKVMIEKSF